MGNLLDYVRTEFRTFEEKPFSSVDSLVLSECAYIRPPVGPVPSFESERNITTVPITAMLRAEDYPLMFAAASESVNRERMDVLCALAQSPRWRGLGIGETTEFTDLEAQTQFAAMTFDLTGCVGYGSARPTLYVVFRGTDGTLVGWKEDFNMAATFPVPSQSMAADYLASVVRRSEDPPRATAAAILTGGHSKGGNLAVYAAMSLDTKDRVDRIFSHDGPGFPSRIIASAEYRCIEERIDKTIPESSIIGMLLESGARPTIVTSNAVSILQHMCGSWQIGDGRFVTAPELTRGAQLVNRTISGWVDQIPESRRRLVIDEVYGIFTAAGYGQFADLAQHWTEALPKIVAAARGTDPEARAIITDVLKTIPQFAVRSLKDGASSAGE
jgi:hypothetical protein